MLSGSFPIIAPSNHTTFSQTQTDATVPLKPLMIDCLVCFSLARVHCRLPRAVDMLGRIQYFKAALLHE
jgi:hypothetical protein